MAYENENSSSLGKQDANSDGQSGDRKCGINEFMFVKLPLIYVRFRKFYL